MVGSFIFYNLKANYYLKRAYTGKIKGKYT
jgi:hypothetical protein